MIAVQINVCLINKTRLFEGKNGAKYLNAVLIETPDSKYKNDYMVVESVSQEERQAGKKGKIIGNAKIIKKGSRSSNGPPVEDDIPF